MNRRKAVWIALTAGIAMMAALVVAGRLRRRSAAVGTDWAPDPGPQSIATAAPSTGDVMEASAPATGSLARPAPAEVEEQPLPTWVRLTIVGLALLAFLAISLIATKGV